MRRRRAMGLGAAAAFAALAGLTTLQLQPAPDVQTLDTLSPRVARLFEDTREALAADAEEEPSVEVLEHGLVLPTGAPTALGCREARLVVRQARSNLAGTPPPLSDKDFVEATLDWLDPHGLWSVAPDSPLRPALRAAGRALLAELEADPEGGACTTAERLGKALGHWSAALRTHFDQGFERADASGLSIDLERGFAAASLRPYEDGPTSKTARQLALELGGQARVAREAYGAEAQPFIEALRERTAPDLDVESWSRVVLAAAVRAYIPQLDAHGAWAPLDEELSIYDVGLEESPPERLWEDMSRTLLGVRIEEGALPPLQRGDVLLRAHGVVLAGVSVEQLEQLAVLRSDERAAGIHVTVLRRGEASPRELLVGQATVPDANVALDEQPSGLPSERVAYAEGEALVLKIDEVPDNLGALVEGALHAARAEGQLRGVLLDLRGNGGGSTEGAIETLGLFLPGATLFPMQRRDGTVEVDRAPLVAPERQWTGPVAALVDSDTASAAEMLAGALAAYRRGTLLGARTFGKGCAQEYLDDDASTGVLRLTTLRYALPDGSPVQKVGLTPSVHLSLPTSNEREALSRQALGPWRGPDVRDRPLIREVPWPGHGGRVGPCQDEQVCRALRSLGSSPAARMR